MGSHPDEASTRLRAAVGLHAAGRRDAQAQLRRALPFLRQVGATAHLQEGMVGRP
jgi:hypothetical protein